MFAADQAEGGCVLLAESDHVRQLGQCLTDEAMPLDLRAGGALFPGQSPARPAVDILFSVRLHRYGIDGHAGRKTARLALAAELPASVLADPTGISISTAERWSQWAKRDWAAYVAERSASS